MTPPPFSQQTDCDAQAGRELQPRETPLGRTHDVTCASSVNMLFSLIRCPVSALCVALILALSLTDIGRCASPEKAPSPSPVVRYALPPDVLQKPYVFAGETIPLQRSDVRYRITAQINFLLLDARSVLIEWLKLHESRGWLLKQLLEKEGVPDEFALFAAVLPGMVKGNQKVSYAGLWFLDKPCQKDEGVEMEDDAWRDDRMDIQLATRCFASRIKSLRSQVKGEGWLMAAAAYVGGAAAIKDAQIKWDSTSFWDIPLPLATEQLIARWIALTIINVHRQFYDINIPRQAPLVFEQLVGIRLTRDLSIGQIAQFLGLPAREVLAINPKIKANNPMFPAKVGTRIVTHTIQTPKGKGALLMEKLRQAGYLMENQAGK